MQQRNKIIYSSRWAGTIPLHPFIYNRWSQKHHYVFPGVNSKGELYVC